jgi:hypothetical protein
MNRTKHHQRGTAWSKQEERTLFELWPYVREIAQHTGRSVIAVRLRACKYNLSVRKTLRERGEKNTRVEARQRSNLSSLCNSWSADETARLKENFQTYEKEELEKMFNRSYKNIYAKAYCLGFRKKGCITDADAERWLRQAARFENRDPNMVTGMIAANPSILKLKKAQVLLNRKVRESGYNLKKKERKGQFWTVEKDRLLTGMYSSYTLDDISNRLGCAKLTIWKRACLLGLGRKQRINKVAV